MLWSLPLPGPNHPFWYFNIVVNPLVELQDGAVKREMWAREVLSEEKTQRWKRADRGPIPSFPLTALEQVVKSPSSSSSAFRAKAAAGALQKPVACMDNEISELLLIAILCVVAVLIADWATRPQNRGDDD